MEEKNKKRQVAKITVFIASVFVIFMSVTYAFITQNLTGTKEVVINAGVLDLVLEEENEITISDALPMYDEVGMIQEPFTFSLVNNGINAVDYELKLVDVTPQTVECKCSELGEITLDSPAGCRETIYPEELRKEALMLCQDWYPDVTTESECASAAQMDGAPFNTFEGFIDYFIVEGVFEDTRTLIDTYPDNVVEISVWELPDWPIRYGLTRNGENTIGSIEDMEYTWKIDDLGLRERTLEMCKNWYPEVTDEASCLETVNDDWGTNYKTFDDFVGEEFWPNGGRRFTLDIGKIGANETINYDLRLWISEYVEDIEDIEGLTFSFKIDVEVEQEIATPIIPTTVTFGGVTKSVNPVTDTMFNYTSEGVDPLGGVNVEATNGIYVMKENNAYTYFYRGQVDNLVKFGEYKEDYYVYAFSTVFFTDEFASLEDCQYSYSDCSESNKILKYSAGTPMYWKIIRVNGDKTIRMIYAGTTPDAIGENTGIGLSRYTDAESYEPKYSGYTYDNNETKISSLAKREIDNWYANALEGTEYDSDIAIGKFCSDSSGYKNDKDIDFQFGTTNLYTFEGFRRNFANMLHIGNVSPTFECRSNEMDSNIGGSYRLKAGLITLDEVIAAGGQQAKNSSYYLYNGSEEEPYGESFLSMTPMSYNLVGIVDYEGRAGQLDITDAGYAFGHASSISYSLRPVINLKADVVFKEGTDGSKEHPYELAE